MKQFNRSSLSRKRKWSRGHVGKSNSDGVVYVTKWPPSPSGVGLYASVFEGVLARVGKVLRVEAPSDPSDSQRLGSALRGLLRGWRTRHSDYRIHVEVAGRSLYELYYLLAALTVHKRVSVTLHDVPQLAGPALLFSEFDRWPFRRLLLHASAKMQKRIVVPALKRAEAVFTLTEAGALRMSQELGRDVKSLGHVVKSCDHLPKEDILFFPGYIGDSEPVVSFLEQWFAQGEDIQGWRIIVGACSPGVRESLENMVPGGALMEYSGSLREAELMGLLASAAIVARPRPLVQGANCLAASGPLAWAVGYGAVVVTNDSRAGSRELADKDLLLLTDGTNWRVDEALEWVARDAGRGVRERANAGYSVEAVLKHFLDGVKPEDGATSVARNARTDR